MVDLFNKGRAAEEVMQKLAIKDRTKKKPAGFGKKV